MRRGTATDGNKAGLSDEDLTENFTKASCGRHLALPSGTHASLSIRVFSS